MCVYLDEIYRVLSLYHMVPSPFLFSSNLSLNWCTLVDVIISSVSYYRF